ncbi:hypothetical protein GWK47_033388 [Chionoecetes opilio]|uniref:Uncharacterized protein n=1 Tax=Chionoecetes opilio TaxID=41210 RepID=A0A8J4YS27_CHIOP|nr:hypothetical protein GWK47_033388 [Chionoecetes opilio]
MWVLRPRTPKEDSEYGPSGLRKGEFVEAHRRSSRRDVWSWPTDSALLKSSPTNSRGSTEMSNGDLAAEPPPRTFKLFSISTSRPATPPPRAPRRASAPIPRKECFFCGDGDKPNEVLHRVSTTWSANRIIEAVHNGTNSEWKIQLPPDLDVLAAHVMYHKGCWSIHVVNKIATVGPHSTRARRSLPDRVRGRG